MVLIPTLRVELYTSGWYFAPIESVITHPEGGIIHSGVVFHTNRGVNIHQLWVVFCTQAAVVIRVYIYTLVLGWNFTPATPKRVVNGDHL